MLGTAPSLFSFGDIPPFFLMAWLLVYWSPRDAVFRALRAPRSPVRLVALALEAIDALTTVTGRMEKAGRFFPNSPAAPFIAGQVVSHGGALFRYWEQLGRGVQVSTPWAEASPALYRGIIYSTVYWIWLSARRRSCIAASKKKEGVMQSDMSKSAPVEDPAELPRLCLCTFHVVLEMAKELTQRSIDPFSATAKVGGRMLLRVAQSLQLGELYGRARVL